MRRPAGRRGWRFASFRITDEPIPEWDESLLPAAGRDRRVRRPRAGGDAAVLQPPRGDGAGEDSRPEDRRGAAPHGRRRATSTTAAGCGSAAASRTASSRRTARCSPTWSSRCSTTSPVCVHARPGRRDRDGVTTRCSASRWTGTQAVERRIARPAAKSCASRFRAHAKHQHVPRVRSASPWTSGTTRRSSARSWRCGPTGSVGKHWTPGGESHEGPRHRRRRVPRRGGRRGCCGSAATSFARSPAPPTRGSTNSASSRSSATSRTRRPSSGRWPGCDVVFHVAAKAGVWGRYAGLLRHQRHRHRERHRRVQEARRPQARLHLDAERRPRRRRHRRGERIAAVPQALRRRLPRDEGRWPRRRCWRRTARTSPRSRCART